MMVHVVKSPLKTKPFCLEGINHFPFAPKWTKFPFVSHGFGVQYYLIYMA